jgi:hypothetical protein
MDGLARSEITIAPGSLRPCQGIHWVSRARP